MLKQSQPTFAMLKTGSHFDILDKWAIMIILKYLDAYDIVFNLKPTCKGLKYVVDEYLKDRFYKSDFLIRQNEMLIFRRERIKCEMQKIEDQINLIDNRYAKHNNIKPYVCLASAPTMYYIKKIRWVYSSIEVHIKSLNWGKSSSTSNVICIKKGYSNKIYRHIKNVMSENNIHRIFLTKAMRFRNDVQMAFSRNEYNNYKIFYRCKVCKGDHSLLDCNKVTCNLCKKKGHLTRSCSKLKCGMCNGHHLTSRCRSIVCRKCNRMGHIEKRCRK